MRIQNMLTAISEDSAIQDLEDACDDGSYWGGKAIGRVARLASISRAFETDDYVQLDEQLRLCLEKWLRLDGKYIIIF